MTELALQGPGAAEQCHEQDWTNRRSAARNAANHELFVNAAVVEAQGLDATELYQPRDEIA
jgi:hypothetical protein